MLVHAIDREVLDLLLEMGKSNFPDEFIVMLGMEKGVITTVYPIAGTTVTSDSATIFMEMIPLGMQIAGTAHCHPRGALWPSDADLQIFSESGSAILLWAILLRWIRGAVLIVRDMSDLWRLSLREMGCCDRDV